MRLAKWMLKNINANTKMLSEEAAISPFLTKLLVNRGFTTSKDIKEFLKPEDDSLSDPYLMKGMKLAVDIIKEKISTQKKILVVGDYDCDGIFSTYCLYNSLLDLGANVDYYIPHRIVEGYGINISIIEKASEDNVDTIITCDNGIAAMQQIQRAKKLGITVIITDHHDLPTGIDENGDKYVILPDADAVINPKQKDCKYPFESLCGAGVVLQFVRCMFESIQPKLYESRWPYYFQFAAIATVCDVVDLLGENRYIVKRGLEQLNNTTNTGLKALIKEAHIEGVEIQAYHLGFVIGPCINATGRLETAGLSLELLNCNDENQAILLAKRLVEINDVRKNMTEECVEKVLNKLHTEKMLEDKIFVVYEPTIHESIAGIVAGRVKEKYNTPTIVLTQGHEMPKGSARSIEKYNMFEELSKCKSLMSKFGGHPMAAGLSIEECNIEILRKMLNDKCVLNEEDKIPVISVDMVLSIEYLNYSILEDIKMVEPFGKGNPKPLFADKGLKVVKARVLGKNQNMLKLQLKNSKGNSIEAIQFDGVASFNRFINENYRSEAINFANGLNLNNVYIDIVYSPSTNEYNGYKTIQLQLNDYRKSK